MRAYWLLCDREARKMGVNYKPVVKDDNSYVESGLPPFLQESVEAMKTAWDKNIELVEEFLQTYI